MQHVWGDQSKSVECSCPFPLLLFFFSFLSLLLFLVFCSFSSFWQSATICQSASRPRNACLPLHPLSVPLFPIPHLFLTVYFDFVFLNCGHSRKLFLSTGHDVNKWAFVLIFIPTHEHEYGQIALHTHVCVSRYSGEIYKDPFRIVLLLAFLVRLSCSYFVSWTK